VFQLFDVNYPITGLLKELEIDGQVYSSGHGAGAFWHLRVKD
jgi:hypothetical protein